MRDVDVTIAFYTNILGLEVITFGADRKALRFGDQKINLHPLPPTIDLVANVPTPGSADLCFITANPIMEVIAHLQANDVPIIAGPVERSEAQNPLQSVYFRDPDLNLIEVSNPI